jgi:hypothetical protein
MWPENFFETRRSRADCSREHRQSRPVNGYELPLRVIACPLEHFDAIGFVAHRVEDFAVAYALESGAHLSGSQNVADRIYVIFLYTNFQNFCWR